MLFACKESRNATVLLYKRVLEEEYDIRGKTVLNPVSGIEKSPTSMPPRTGLAINYSIDAIIMPVNIPTRSAILELHHFSAVAAQQIPHLRKFIVHLRIFMPPYKFWSSRRFQYWRKWGETSWWVPIRYLLRMRALEEVVLLRNGEEKLLPSEWKSRVIAQWTEELLKVKDAWPVEWEGKMPSLRFVTSVAEA